MMHDRLTHWNTPMHHDPTGRIARSPSVYHATERVERRFAFERHVLPDAIEWPDDDEPHAFGVQEPAGDVLDSGRGDGVDARAERGARAMVAIVQSLPCERPRRRFAIVEPHAELTVAQRTLRHA
jgi:hypothetical protein